MRQSCPVIKSTNMIEWLWANELWEKAGYKGNQIYSYDQKFKKIGPKIRILTLNPWSLYLIYNILLLGQNLEHRAEK